jgi:hypothetical protein
MIEEKKKISFLKAGYTEIKYSDQKINVKQYLTDEDQQIMIGVYLNELFNEDAVDPQYNLLRAENSLFITLIERCTDIQLFEDDNPLLNINDLFANMHLVKEIRSTIENYKDFRERLDATVELQKENRRLKVALGSVIDKIYAKLSDLLVNLSEMDFSPEKIEDLRKVLGEIKESPVINNTIEMFEGKSLKKVE